jgi:hypothetical protein
LVANMQLGGGLLCMNYVKRVDGPVERMTQYWQIDTVPSRLDREVGIGIVKLLPPANQIKRH